MESKPVKDESSDTVSKTGEFIEHPTEKAPEIRHKIDTQSSIPVEENQCGSCSQMEQTLDTALTFIHDMLQQYEEGSTKRLEKYHPLLSTVYMSKQAGLQELADLRTREKSEVNGLQTAQPLDNTIQISQSVQNDVANQEGMEMPKRLPLSKSQFKDLIGKARIKTEALSIDGIEHLGVIHDISLTREPRVYRFCGDRYTARVLLQSGSPSLLDMKEISQRSLN